jgi:hypothetical protein
MSRHGRQERHPQPAVELRQQFTRVRRFGVEIARRLVGHHESRLMHERSRQCSAAVRRQIPAPGNGRARIESDAGEGSDARAPRARGLSGQKQRQLHVLDD